MPAKGEILVETPKTRRGTHFISPLNNALRTIDALVSTMRKPKTRYKNATPLSRAKGKDLNKDLSRQSIVQKYRSSGLSEYVIDAVLDVINHGEIGAGEVNTRLAKKHGNQLYKELFRLERR